MFNILASKMSPGCVDPSNTFLRNTKFRLRLKFLIVSIISDPTVKEIEADVMATVQNTVA